MYGLFACLRLLGSKAISSYMSSLKPSYVVAKVQMMLE
jgi:hypothetical protein